MSHENSIATKAALELLQTARQARDQAILEPVLRDRLRDDQLEKNSSLSSLLAVESVKLHERLAKLDRFSRLTKHLGRKAVTERDGTIFLKEGILGTYSITSPVLFQSSPELIENSRITDGYTFMTFKQPFRATATPRVIISQVTLDTFNQHSQNKALYDIFVEDKEEPHALIGGPALNPKAKEVDYLAGELHRSRYKAMQEAHAVDPKIIQYQATISRLTGLGVQPGDNDEAYLFPLGLVQQANQVLSRK